MKIANLPRYKLFLLLLLASWTSGCARAKPKTGQTDWRLANIHKVVVVCVQRDQIANRRIESEMVPKLRHQGFEALTPQELFPAASSYSPKGLMNLMQRARVDGIMEIIYSGEIPEDGLPRTVKFKYHSIKGQAAKLSDRLRSLDSALIALIGA